MATYESIRRKIVDGKYTGPAGARRAIAYAKKLTKTQRFQLAKLVEQRDWSNGTLKVPVEMSAESLLGLGPRLPPILQEPSQELVQAHEDAANGQANGHSYKISEILKMRESAEQAQQRFERALAKLQPSELQQYAAAWAKIELP